MNARSLKAALVPLIKKVTDEDRFSLSPLSGGGNNRSYQVRQGNKRLFLKAYFHHPSDHRNRLASEFSFCRFVHDLGFGLVPQPLARDLKNKLGLYEFMDGKPVSLKRINRLEVSQALSFFQKVNEARFCQAARRLPSASEACFSISDHLTVLRKRMERLLTLQPETELHRKAISFCREELFPCWDQTVTFVLAESAACGLDIRRPLRLKERCLSPSDFGFHNALRTKSGALRFFDFEYAGWDDPAKTVNDFFYQPRCRVPEKFYEYFRDGVARTLGAGKTFRDRAYFLRPVIGLKWCCIMLNEFMPALNRPRRFAFGPQDRQQRWQRQLLKARAQLQRVRSDNGLR